MFLSSVLLSFFPSFLLKKKGPLLVFFYSGRYGLGPFLPISRPHRLSRGAAQHLVTL